MIYLDHAATSYPKPACVAAAMSAYAQTAGNPGRSGHRLSRRSEEALWHTRRRIAELFGAEDPDRVVFTLNATMALNMAIKGLTRPGDRVLTSSFEHNSVVRPLHALHGRQVAWQAVPPASDAPVDLNRLEDELRAGGVRLVVVCHASNITGAVVPLEPVRRLTDKYGAVLVLDAAQSAGHLPVRADQADVVVFSGHKGLLGPQGTGGMYISERVTVRPLLEGGTGGRSELREQPRWLPWSLESGTPNGIGVAGLGAGVEYLLARDLRQLGRRERRYRRMLVDGVRPLPGVSVHEQPSGEAPIGVVSLSFAGLPATDAAALLEERHDLLVRGGLHCGPVAHQTVGTLPGGTVRFSMSHLNSESDITAAVSAVAELAAGVRPRVSPARPAAPTRPAR